MLNQFKKYIQDKTKITDDQFDLISSALNIKKNWTDMRSCDEAGQVVAGNEIKIVSKVKLVKQA